MGLTFGIVSARDGRRVTCELRDHGEPAGAEVQLLENGEFYAGGRFDMRDLAFRHAEHIRGRTLNATAGASHPHSTDDYLAADARHRGRGPFEGAEWTYEVKWDGYRIIVVIGSRRLAA